MTVVELQHGPIAYRDFGPPDSEFPPVLFIHAFLVDGTVWASVARKLAAHRVRSYAPDWPLGAHRIPVKRDADQSPRGVARAILEFLEALELRDVTLVGNDTGGALAQFLIDTDPDRIGRVVLTNSDAFDTFPPFPFNLIFRLLSGPTRMKLNLLPMRARAFRHSNLGFGMLANELDPEQTRSWIEPALSDLQIREDAARFLRAIDPGDLAGVTDRMSEFPGDVRVVWGMDDRAFTPNLGRRLATVFPRASFVEVPGARTFVQLDAPDALTGQILKSTESEQR